MTEEREKDGRQLRGRILTPDSDVWQFNAWDTPPWTEQDDEDVERRLQEQKAQAPVLSDTQLTEHCRLASQKWDVFYRHHARWFFKDRQWLASEFPELLEVDRPHVLELGCGPGNTLFPLARLRNALGPHLYTYGCDFSAEAVRLVQGFREYDPACMHVFQHDLTAPEGLPGPHFDPLVQYDAVAAIFVLSAVSPASLPAVFAKALAALRPGGCLLFRDYGRGDLNQLRFKSHRLLCAPADFYQRGDGTDVHFFTLAELETLARGAGFQVSYVTCDRRLIVNRLRKLTMPRVWLQAKFLKPHAES
jgi:tRNAThr (cytosine32-N3)-methyltransferase